MDIQVTRDGTHKSGVVRLKPRTFTVRKFKPNEFGSRWAQRGIFDGDELIGLADLLPDDEEGSAESTKAELAEFMRSPDSAAPGVAQRLLNELIAIRMSEHGWSYGAAEVMVVQEPQAQILWERARQDRLEPDE